MKHRKILFVLADGSRARLVRRSPETGDFVTVSQINGKGRLAEVRAWMHTHAAGRTHESNSSGRSSVGPDDPYRQVKADFMAKAASEAMTLSDDGAFEGVVLVATKRLLPILREEIGAGAVVLNELAKDLTKVPDHELPAWLDSLELVPQEA